MILSVLYTRIIQSRMKIALGYSITPKGKLTCSTINIYVMG